MAGLLSIFQDIFSIKGLIENIVNSDSPFGLSQKILSKPKIQRLCISQTLLFIDVSRRKKFDHFFGLKKE